MPTPPTRSRLPVLAWLGLGCLGLLVVAAVLAVLAWVFYFRVQEHRAVTARAMAAKEESAAIAAALQTAANAVSEPAEASPEGDDASGLPVWLPPPPDLADAGLRVEAGPDRSGSFTAESNAEPESVLAFYRENLGAQGFRIREEAFSLGADSSQATLFASHPDNGRQLGLMVIRNADGGSRVTGQFVSPEP